MGSGPLELGNQREFLRGCQNCMIGAPNSMGNCLQSVRRFSPCRDLARVADLLRMHAPWARCVFCSSRRDCQSDFNFWSPPSTIS